LSVVNPNMDLVKVFNAVPSGIDTSLITRAGRGVFGKEMIEIRFVFFLFK